MKTSRPLPVFLLLAAAALGPNCSCEEPAGKKKTDEDPTPTGSGVVVTSDRARACEVLFSTASGALPSVTFSDVVTGESIPKAPRLAIAFHARQDASLKDKGVADLSADASLVSARCYDAAGALIAGETVALAD